MKMPTHAARATLAALMVFQTLLPSTAHADNLVAKLKRMVSEAEYSGTPPITGSDSSIECAWPRTSTGSNTTSIRMVRSSRSSPISGAKLDSPNIATNTNA